ncbi:hypothetical protein HBH82_194510 [Parastagonospora nodorum]|nr:hypothetical protein HBH82_194510 [Parastagonospora nodorum]KAH4671522.1 hypothetical protein HBH78_180260 [Parastagonospora nodorum]KAH4695958.1 hypothetical protein HBH67_192600 [Parastagonospora nodorum]KAH4763374.1 hypothetical protein HBH63_192170 [Parastagonospora nodorum]
MSETRLKFDADRPVSTPECSNKKATEEGKEDEEHVWFSVGEDFSTRPREPVGIWSIQVDSTDLHAAHQASGRVGLKPVSLTASLGDKGTLHSVDDKTQEGQGCILRSAPQAGRWWRRVRAEPELQAQPAQPASATKTANRTLMRVGAPLVKDSEAVHP